MRRLFLTLGIAFLACLLAFTNIYNHCLVKVGFNATPRGIKWRFNGKGVDSVPISTIYEIGAVVEKGSEYRNTFDVVAHHEKLPSNVTGVRFNVETVPAAFRRHLHKPRLSRAAALKDLRRSSYQAYRQQFEDRRRCPLKNEKDMRLEAVSKHDANLIYAGGNGFLVASVMAFAQHLPLHLSPDHIWSLIMFAFAKHVDLNSEELRFKFVQHEGKERILIRTPDYFQMSQNGYPGSGASSKSWEKHVFDKFADRIREHIGEDTYNAVVANFSTSTPSSRAANEIALMSATKNYFSFGMYTCCGIPSITLLGTEEDWVDLRRRTNELSHLMTTEFSEYWMPLLLPILDEFVKSYRGKVNHGFWQSMVKLRSTGFGSGSQAFISGWMQILFPYLANNKLNTDLHTWQEMFFFGPQPDQFPPVVSSAPVDWDYYGSVFDMGFHAGMIGVRQDPSDGGLSPTTGWYVTHEPKEPLQEL